MGFFATVGTFAVAAGVLIFGIASKSINFDVPGLLIVLFVLAGVVYPFYGAYQAKKQAVPSSKNDEDAEDKEAIDKALVALAEATKALEAKKKT